MAKGLSCLFGTGKKFYVKDLQRSHLENPFFPFGVLKPFEASSSSCFNTDNSSASAVRLKVQLLLKFIINHLEND